MQKKSKNSDGIDESRCQKRALNMSGFAVELAPMQPSKDAAGSQNLPPSSQSTVYLPPPDLITTFAQSPSHRRVESDSRLNARNPNDVALVRRTSSDPLPAGAERRLQPWTASPAHAQPAGQPQKLKTLVHRLAHIRYLPPKNSIASLTGIRQHIAHFLHLYRTGLKKRTPRSFFRDPTSQSILLPHRARHYSHYISRRRRSLLRNHAGIRMPAPKPPQ